MLMAMANSTRLGSAYDSTKMVLLLDKVLTLVEAQ